MNRVIDDEMNPMERRLNNAYLKAWQHEEAMQNLNNPLPIGDRPKNFDPRRKKPENIESSDDDDDDDASENHEKMAEPTHVEPRQERPKQRQNSNSSAGKLDRDDGKLVAKTEVDELEQRMKEAASQYERIDSLSVYSDASSEVKRLESRAASDNGYDDHEDGNYAAAHDSSGGGTDRHHSRRHRGRGGGSNSDGHYHHHHHHHHHQRGHHRHHHDHDHRHRHSHTRSDSSHSSKGPKDAFKYSHADMRRFHRMMRKEYDAEHEKTGSTLSYIQAPYARDTDRDMSSELSQVYTKQYIPGRTFKQTAKEVLL